MITRALISIARCCLGGGSFFRPYMGGLMATYRGTYLETIGGVPLLDTGRCYSMDHNQELSNLLHDLSSEQLQQVLKYTRSLQGDLNQEAFDYVIQNYNETLNKLTDEEE